jgi:hypothetical protein
MPRVFRGGTANNFRCRKGRTSSSCLKLLILRGLSARAFARASCQTALHRAASRRRVLSNRWLQWSVTTKPTHIQISANFCSCFVMVRALVSSANQLTCSSGRASSCSSSCFKLLVRSRNSSDREKCKLLVLRHASSSSFFRGLPAGAPAPNFLRNCSSEAGDRKRVYRTIGPQRSLR